MKKFTWILLIVMIVCLLCALVMIIFGIRQVGKTPVNPPVIVEPNWDSPVTRDLVKRACFDCHSNETIWPWYSQVPPASFLIARDVEEGRRKLNFSEWTSNGGEEQEDIEEIIEVIRKGEMPLPQYLLLHPEAKLSPEETQQLIFGLQNTLR